MAVGQPAVVEQLQQDVEDVGVGLFDLVEQDHASRAAGAPLRSAGRPRRSRRSPAARRPGATRCASPCTRTCRCGSSRLRRRTGTRPAPAPARSCRRRSGPRKMNDPIGRFGSLRPARARTTASATAETASSWPITRLCRCSSRWASFCTSPSIRRDTGIPVQRATTSAISSSSTSSLISRSPPPPC